MKPREIRQLLKRATDLALDEVEKRARAIMRANPRCASFCMAMGDACFYDRDGTPLDDNAKYMRPLFTLIYEFDDALKLTGCPMKIDGPNAPRESNW